MTLSDDLRAFRDRARHAPPHVHRCPECYEPEACGLDCDIEPDLMLDNGMPCGSCLVCSGCRKACGPSSRGASHKRRPPSPSDRPPVGDEPGSLLDRLEET